VARLCSLATIVACVSLQSLLAAEPFAGASAFLENHCLACHNADDPNGNLDIGALNFSADDRDNFARWVKIHDRVKAGEMPPADEPRPEAKALSSFVDKLATTLTESERAIYARDGRALNVLHVQMARYLSGAEYTMQDVIKAVWKHPEANTSYSASRPRRNQVRSSLAFS
jgi:hypothetical protein